MAIQYDEIGNRLRAFRLGAGLSADEVALQLGISRTALYRFEKGELVKIDTLERLADLLGVSITTLLGVGTEYIPSPVSYFERIRQIERIAEHIHVLAGPLPSLLASEQFLSSLPQVLREAAEDDPHRARALEDVPKMMEILRERRMTYRERRPTIVSLLSAQEIERLLSHGVAGRSGLPESTIKTRRELARAEVEHFVKLLEEQPIGVQMGVVMESLPHSGFHIFRQPGRQMLALSPFRLVPIVQVGVAMITSAPEALMLHEKMVAEMWTRALKGPAGADYLRALLNANHTSESPAATPVAIVARSPRNRRA